jgi:hypothetical protein
MAAQAIAPAAARRPLLWFVSVAILCAAGVLLCGPILRGDARQLFLPKLQRGQILQYEVHGRVERKVTTESNVSSMRGPQDFDADLSNLVRLSVQEVRAAKSQPWVSAEVELLPGPNTPNPRATIPVSKVAFDILDRGQLGRISGLDDLSPEQRLLWQFWVARFAFGWTLPANGMKPGEKWKYEEPELDSSLIADLVWEREVTYARDDSCPVLPDETCAVFLTQSTLKQKSSTKNSTPEDFRLHGLKTFGSAKGENQVISYISLKTGLVLRATEDAQQSMDVTVIKADETNGVHYDINAASHLETLLSPTSAVPPPASTPPPPSH